MEPFNKLDLLLRDRSQLARSSGIASDSTRSSLESAGNLAFRDIPVLNLFGADLNNTNARVILVTSVDTVVLVVEISGDASVPEFANDVLVAGNLGGARYADPVGRTRIEEREIHVGVRGELVDFMRGGVGQEGEVQRVMRGERHCARVELTGGATSGEHSVLGDRQNLFEAIDLLLGVEGVVGGLVEIRVLGVGSVGSLNGRHGELEM